MTGLEISVAGCALLTLTVAGVQVASRNVDLRIRPRSTTLGQVIATRSGRLTVVAAWVWLGLHLFAR